MGKARARVRGIAPGAAAYAGAVVLAAAAFAAFDRSLIGRLVGLALIGALGIWAARAGTTRSILRSAKILTGAFRGPDLDDNEQPPAVAAPWGGDARYRGFVEDADDLMYTLDFAGNFTSINSAVERLLGYARHEAMAMSIFQVVAPDSLQALRDMIARLNATGKPVRVELGMTTKDGRRLPLEVSCQPAHQDGHVVGIQGIGRDISERKAVEAQLQHRLAQLQALRAIDRAVTGSLGLDIRTTLYALLEQAVTHLGVDAVDVLTFHPEANTLEFTVGRNVSDAAQRTSVTLGRGYASQALLDRRMIVVPNVAHGSEDVERMAVLAREGFVGYCATPLIAKGQARGVLEVLQRTELEPHHDWSELIEALALQGALALDIAGVYGDLQRANVNLILAYDETLEGWSRALDLRDKETEGHSRRVVDLTLHLARGMGIPEPDLVHIRRGALLHDIGKMGVPDEILHKAAPLTEPEWEVIRRHPVYAKDLLSPIAYLHESIEIPCCHHEKWDGTGYPQGLREEQIPPAARIFAVADVWDALRSGRPYRPAWSEEQARAYIREQAGKHFDPRVVEVFFKMEASGPERRAGSE